MESSSIMVCLVGHNHEWALNALHLACAMARSNGREVALVKMLPVCHMQWLGTDFGYQEFRELDTDEMDEYIAVTQEYGVPMSAHVFQYFTLTEGIADAANFVHSEVVFATLPEYGIPFWRTYQLWKLSHLLTNDHHHLYTLDQKADQPQWIPSVVAVPLKK